MRWKNYLSDAEGGLNCKNNDLYGTRSNVGWRTDLGNIQAKKATGRGKVAHVSKIVNDDIDIELATDKLADYILDKSEDYTVAQQKEISSQSRCSKEQKCLISASAPSSISSSSKKSIDSFSKDKREYQARKKLDGIKERQYYEKQLQDLKIETLKCEIVIRRELELREAELEEKNRLDEAQTNKSLKSIDRLFNKGKSSLDEVQTNKASKSLGLDQVNSAQQINMNTRNENTAATTTYEIPKRAIPFAFGEKIVPLGSFDGKKENWLHLTQTFKAVVDNQHYETVIKLVILEQHLTGPAKDCIKRFPFTENSYQLVLKTLQDRFGSEDDHASFYLEAIDNLPKIKFSDALGLRKFYDDLNANAQIIENMGPEVAMHLNDPRRMKLLASKLPRNLVVAWATYQEDHTVGADMHAFAE